MFFKNALTRHGVRSDTTVAGLLPPETSCKPSSKVAVTGVKAILPILPDFALNALQIGFVDVDTGVTQAFYLDSYHRLL